VKPSPVREKSCGSVRIFWLERDEVLWRVKEAVRRLLSERPEVKSVYLFGSLAEDRAVPGSDVDLLLILRKSSKPFPERPLEYLSYFDEVGLPCDLFCYTEEEIERTPLAQAVLRRGYRLP